MINLIWAEPWHQEGRLALSRTNALRWGRGAQVGGRRPGPEGGGTAARHARRQIAQGSSAFPARAPWCPSRSQAPLPESREQSKLTRCHGRVSDNSSPQNPCLQGQRGSGVLCWSWSARWKLFCSGRGRSSGFTKMTCCWTTARPWRNAARAPICAVFTLELDLPADRADGRLRPSVWSPSQTPRQNPGTLVYSPRSDTLSEDLVR